MEEKLGSKFRLFISMAPIESKPLFLSDFNPYKFTDILPVLLLIHVYCVFFPPPLFCNDEKHDRSPLS